MLMYLLGELTVFRKVYMAFSFLCVMHLDVKIRSDCPANNNCRKICRRSEDRMLGLVNRKANKHVDFMQTDHK